MTHANPTIEKMPRWTPALAGLIGLIVLAGCTIPFLPAEPGSELPNCGDGTCTSDENAYSCASDCDRFCPGSCDDFNPCTLDLCGATTAYKCVHEALSGDQPQCFDKTCTGNCICTSDQSASCAPEIQIGSCQSYSCDAGVCRAKALEKCCGNGSCETEAGESFLTCPQTKGGDCAYEAFCNNSICDANESCVSCAADCGQCLFAGYLDTPGLHGARLTKRQYFTGIDKTVFTSDPDTLFQYTSDFNTLPTAYYIDKLQNYCLLATGTTCQRIDIFALLANTRTVPVTQLQMSYACYNPVTGERVIDSTEGYVENYMTDWNITAFSLPNQTLFTPAKEIVLTGQNVQAKGSFYVPSDISNDDEVNVLLNTASTEGVSVTYLGPRQKAGLNFRILTMAPPNNNIQFDCNLHLTGQFQDAIPIDQSYGFTVNSIHKNLLCGNQASPGICQQYVYKNGLCQLEYVDNCCGNHTCELGETYDNCSIYEGGDCAYDIFCGNTSCDADESIWSCPLDCGAPLRIGKLESNHSTILSTNLGPTAAYRSSQSFLDLNSQSIRLLSSANSIEGDGNYNLCNPTSGSGQSCQRIDAYTQLLNASSESFTSVTIQYSCKDPVTNTRFFDSNKTANPAAVVSHLRDWNTVSSPTNREALWIDRNTTSRGDQLSGQAHFFVHPTDQSTNLNTRVLLNTGDDNGTSVLLIKPSAWVDLNMSFLSKTDRTILYECDLNVNGRTEFGKTYQQDIKYYLKFFHS